MLILLSFSVCLLTLRYASLASLTEENFTGIANNLGYHLDFRIWVILISLYFFVVTLQIFKKYQWHPSYLKFIALTIMFCINLAPWIPYQENTIHLNALHVLCAMGASILYLGLLSLFINDLRIFDPLEYAYITVRFKMLLGTLITLLLTYGNINSLIELIMTCGFSLFLTDVNTKKNKKN